MFTRMSFNSRRMCLPVVIEETKGGCLLSRLMSRNLNVVVRICLKGRFLDFKRTLLPVVIDFCPSVLNLQVCSSPSNLHVPRQFASR